MGEVCTWSGEKDGFSVSSGKNVSAAKRKNPSRVSGPEADARGDPEGRFLYVGGIGSSDKAHLQIYSGQRKDTLKASRCGVKFNFHAKNILEGKVMLFYELLPSNDPTEIDTISRAANDSWIPISMRVGKISRPFRLMLEVWTIQSQPYHAAFDDIQLINCTTPPAQDPKTPLTNSNVSCVQSNEQRSYECSPGVCIAKGKVCDINVDCEGAVDELEMCGEVTKWSAYCNFENGPCGWYNDSGHDLPWMLMSRNERLVDHTLNSTTGTFMYLILSKKKDIGHRGILRSATFPPPPKNHSNVNSTHYGSCQIRFYYIFSGRSVGDLLLNSVELISGMPNGNVTKLWRSEYQKKVTNWERITLTLPPITHRYYLQFVAHQGLGSIADVAVDDFSLSPECFNPGYKFTTCGATGPIGPTQELCDRAYKSSGLKVEVSSGEIMKGIQRFTVLESGVYSVTAKGAGGGQGLRNRRPSKGDVVYGVFNWTQGEIIYILVGQQGHSACNPKSIGKFPKIQKLCSEIRSKKKRSKRDIKILKNALKVAPLPQSGEGGGGGGGATYIFKLNDASGTYVPLLVAAGGGGLGAIIQDGSISPDGKGFSKTLSGINGRSSSNGTGAGGGWNDTNKLSVHGGLSLALGSFGGKPCREGDGWLTSGGFGGGGGGCSAGGGGGGYTGGDASMNDSIGENGNGGYSYSNSLQVSTVVPSVAVTSRSSIEGSVNIFPSFVGCGCEYQCVVFDVEGVLHSCICPDNQKLDEDGRSCNAALGVTMKSNGPSFFTQHVMTILPIILIIALAIATGMFILYHRYRRHAAQQAQRPECPYVRDSSELQLNRLRQNAAGRVTEYNPNYEFGGSNCTIQDLREINRENLTLVKALGQGAFGEVYQGYLSNVPGEITDIPVAIKTLPELCSDQAEMDFLMEALIMSKFTNPNIVKFIGVCFEKLPKFIVLELLPGGDLKSFLRESRRKPKKPSVLSMRDLLMMAMDVAKGCQYLEDNRFIHRDIAARNCLLTSRDVTRVVKIADFGMARDIYRADYYRKGGKAMLPVKWMPPEAFMDGIFTSKTDVWSFGVLLWEVMSLGFMPYPGRGNQEVMQLVTSGGRLEPPPNCPGPVHQIMIQCWHSAPDERPNFSTILERLGYCLQDPHVTNAPLPVFNRPPSTERDTTIMRPPDSDVCLQVHRNDGKEPQSPSSNDYLVPIPSNYSLCTEKTELQSASSLESVDRILEMDAERDVGPEGASCREPLVERMPSPLKPQPMPIYTGPSNWETSFSKDKNNVSKLAAANWAGYQSVPTQDLDQIKSNSVAGGAVPRVPLATIPPPECSPARKSPPSAIARQRPNYSKKSSATNSTFSPAELSLDAGSLQKQQPPISVTTQPPNHPTQVVSYANVAVSNSEPVRTTSSAISPPSYIYGGTNASAPGMGNANVTSKQDKH